MKKRFLFILILAAFVMGPVFASGNNESAANAGGKPDMTFLIWWAKKFAPDDALIKHVGDEVGANLQIVTIPHNVYYQQITARIASNDLPVLYKLQIPNAPAFKQLQDLTSAGRIENLTALTEKYGLKYWNQFLTRSQFDSLRNKNGGLYISPIWNGPSAAGLYVRLDWMDKLGLTMPKNWDPDMVQFLLKIKQANPNGKLVAPISGGSLMTHIIASYTGGRTMGDPFSKVNGNWEYITDLPGFRSAIEYMHRLYSEGLMHPTALTPSSVSPTEYIRLMSDGTVAVLDHVGLPGHWKSIEDGLKQNDPNARLGFITPYPAGPNGAYWPGGPGYYGGNVINAQKSDTLKKKAAEAINYLFSPDGTKLMFDGVEGIDFTMDNGKMKPIDDARQRDFVGDVSNLVDLVDRSIVWQRESNKWLKENYYNNVKISVQPTVLGLGSNDFVQTSSSVQDVVNQYMTDFIVGHQPLNDATWGKMEQQMKAAGFDQMMKLVSDFMSHQR